MAWNITTARTYLGIADTSKDALITQIMSTVIDTVERYLGRKLFRIVDYVENFYYTRSYQVSLHRYPVESITTIAPEASSYFLNPEAGILVANELIRQPTVTITYTGGYDETLLLPAPAVPLPINLERVLWEILLSFWSVTNTTTGAPILGASATLSATTGPITRVTIPDFMSISYADTTGSSSASAVSTETLETWGPLATWAPTLELYRSEVGAGVGFA